ncbi:MAG TPA: phosphatidylglycerol lysyltransferase domain-containing protein, partial [bacterium]
MELKPLTPQDYPDYKKYFKKQPYHLCTYSLSSIIAWQNSDYQAVAGIWKDTLIIAAEFRNTKSKRHLILPIAPPDIFPPEQLARIACDLDYAEYWFVPQSYLDIHGRDMVDVYFNVEHQQEYDDYIYLTSDLADLKGNKYSKKRNLIKQFNRTHIEANRVEIDTITPKNLEECLDFLEKWCKERDCDANPEEDLACEKLAAINTLINMELYEVNTLMLRIDGVVSAFGVSAFLTSQMATLQYEKAYTHIKGLSQYFDNQCAKRLFNGYTYINKESDMGSEGLAKAKKSY